MDKRIGEIVFNESSQRFRIIYEGNFFDFSELTSGTVCFINILGVWHKTRIEFDGKKDCYYGSGLPMALMDGLKASLSEPTLP